MPFTFSHPAIILPLCKFNSKRFSATALFIGSMAPDFEYFIHMRMYQVHGHSFAGLFYYDLPLTLLLTFIFHLFVRNGLLMHSPKIIREKFAEYLVFDWTAHFRKHWFMIIYSALIGVFLHVFWDAFTHTNGFFVNYIPFLQGDLMIFGYLLKTTDVAQLGSSLIGALAIVFALFRSNTGRIKYEELKQILIYWFIVCFITTVILALRGVESIGDIIATTIAGGLIGLIVTPRIMRSIKLMP
jgi:hypothetical protein